MTEGAAAVVLAAGEGKRFGKAKQFALLKDRAVLCWSLEAFQDHPQVDEIVLVLRRGRRADPFLRKYSKVTAVARGGARRQDSVRSGLRRVNERRTPVVLIHDGVRPLVSGELISRVLEGLRTRKAVIPVVPVEETVKRVRGDRVVRTVDRSRLFRAQTPQGYDVALLRAAISAAEEDGYCGTDEAVLVERLGEEVFTVTGDPANIKITSPLDLQMAEALIEA